MVATIPDIQPANEDEISEPPPNANNVSNSRGNRRVVSRSPSSNNKGKGRPRKTGGSRPRVVNQEESDEEEEDVEETEDEEEGEIESSAGVVSVDRVIDTSNSRPAPIMDQVPLPVVDDDYDNV